MKTTKVILVAALMAFASISFAQNDAKPFNDAKASIEKPAPKLTALINIKTAMQNRGLVAAMRSQLSPRFLQVEKPVYIVQVKFKKTVYSIYGSYAAWKHFFAIKPLPIIKGR